VQMIANRLHIKDPMEESTFTYEDFFSRYFSKLNDQEKLEFAEIRSITDTLYENHRRIRELIDAGPQVLDEIRELCNLQNHLKFWDKKYENTFSQRRDMCVIYPGQSDHVPFPHGLFEALDMWLDSHKPVT
jgi:hypothetical protein